jgi:galactose oxidase-like protein
MLYRPILLENKASPSWGSGFFDLFYRIPQRVDSLSTNLFLCQARLIGLYRQLLDAFLQDLNHLGGLVGRGFFDDWSDCLAKFRDGGVFGHKNLSRGKGGWVYSIEELYIGELIVWHLGRKNNSLFRGHPMVVKPTPAAFSPFVYDTSSGNAVLIDTGNFPAFEEFSVQTWTWNGSVFALQLAGIANNPALRDLTGAAYDASSGHVVLFAGKGPPGTELMNDTWEYNGSTWTNTVANYSSTAPQIRKSPYMAPMTSPSAQVVMFGGISEYFILQDTWSYASGTWTQLSPTVSPSIRVGASFASNGTNQAILFGGANESFMLNDVYSWNGTNWSQLVAGYASGSPSVRKDCAFAYYPTGTPAYILFGGQDASGNTLGDTWSFNPAGPTWTQLSPTASPSNRVGASMIYDTGSSQLLLFGGKDNWGNLLNDLWSWSGTNWVQQIASDVNG